MIRLRCAGTSKPQFRIKAYTSLRRYMITLIISRLSLGPVHRIHVSAPRRARRCVDLSFAKTPASASRYYRPVFRSIRRCCHRLLFLPSARSPWLEPFCEYQHSKLLVHAILSLSDQLIAMQQFLLRFDDCNAEHSSFYVNQDCPGNIATQRCTCPDSALVSVS